MSFKIGFTANIENENKQETIQVEKTTIEPHKSIVRVHFPARNLTCTYYNDLFDLHVGDMVYVEGKLEGMQGRVVDVSYSFKIKLSDYKKVIQLIDTSIHGEFFFDDSHAIAYNKDAIAFDKVFYWFKAPAGKEDEFVSSTDNNSFSLDDLSGMNIEKAVADRGYDYYMQNRVAYIEIDGVNGKAIVEGSEIYTVEFEYNKGEIKNLMCDCYCTGACKHEFAVILQLRETLKFIEENYKDSYNGYFACIRKNILLKYLLNKKTPAKITVE